MVKFILSEAELACKSEADGYTHYVMRVREHTNSSEFIKFFVNKILISHGLYYRKPNLLARVRLMVIHTM